MRLQKTLKDEVHTQGVGLHSGRPVKLTIRPAQPNAGICFIRSDLGGERIPARHEYIANTELATTLAHGKAQISTVEHVLGALEGLGIENAEIEVSGPELPILDGSGSPFYRMIQEVGIQTQLNSRTLLVLKDRIELKVGEKWAVAEPHDRFEITASIEWDHPVIGYQEFTYIEGETDFEEIVSARTFGFLRDVEALRRMGLARGASLDNAVGLDDTGVVNPGGLRFSDEFVRHKVLDALGDFKLAGLAFQARFRMHRPGHHLHYCLIKEIMARPQAFQILRAQDKTVEPQLGPELAAV